VCSNAVHTLQRTHCVSITKTNRLMIFRNVIAFYSDYEIYINIFYGQNTKFLHVEPGSSLHNAH
jgi:hypothetical protein